MATIAENISRIQTAKADIKASIEAKGVTVPSSALIDQYADYIDEISGGGGGQAKEDLKNLIEMDIETLDIPNGTTAIGDYAFYEGKSLLDVTIPDSVTTIGRNAFYKCIHLISIIIPSSVTSISAYAFSNCSDLIGINIPSGVTIIGGNAFSGCRSLTSITIPSGVTSIGTNAFNGCSGLTSITVEATTPPTITTTTFNNTNNCPIYVPSASVAAYKAADKWSGLASRIQPISE